MANNEWYEPDPGLRTYIAQQIAQSGASAGPLEAAYFQLNISRLGPGAVIPVDPTIRSVMQLLDYESSYRTPDQYWGEDVSVAQVPLVIPEYDTHPGGSGNFGPKFPPGPSVYWVEASVDFTLVDPAPATFLEPSALQGNVNGNIKGFVAINEGTSVGFLGFGELFTVLAPEDGDGQAVVVASESGVADPNIIVTDDGALQGWVTYIKIR